MTNYSTAPTILKNALTPEPQKNWSKKVTGRRRRSAAKDRKAIAITRSSALPRPTPTDAPLVASARHPLSHPLAANDDIKAGEKPAKIHRWEHTTDLGKVTAANRALYDRGRAYSFSINLGPRQIDAANDNLKGFTDHFARNINRALKRALGYVPLYGFAVGVKAGRLHLHGGIEANDNEEPATKAAIDSVGDWEATHGRKYKLHWEPMYTPDIWASYCMRDQAKAKRLIRGRAISITTPLRRRAKEHWSRLA